MRPDDAGRAGSMRSSTRFGPSHYRYPELFTDADNFGVELTNVDQDLKALAFAATVLIDVVHFERSKG